MLVLFTLVTVEVLAKVKVVPQGGGDCNNSIAVGLGCTYTTATEEEGQLRLLIRSSETVYVPTVL